MNNQTKKNICIFICELKYKNYSQIKILNKFDYNVTVFVHSNLENSKNYIGTQNKVFLLKPTLFARLLQIINFFKQNKSSLAHSEIYGGSRFAIFYLIISKLFNVKTLNIERGALNEYIDPQSAMSKIARISQYLLYRYSDFTWYKEYYMLEYLIKYKCKNLHFIPNAVETLDSPEIIKSFNERSINYLWVNRIIPIRHIDWVIEAAQKQEFSNKQFVIVGFLADEYSQNKKNEIESLKLKNVQLVDYTENTKSYYKYSQYFLLPSDYVFGNNALLESLTYGVVPIVSNVNGVDKIVDNRNGITFENNKTQFIKALHETLNIEESKWKVYSENSIAKIKQDYNTDTIEKKIMALYNEIELK